MADPNGYVYLHDLIMVAAALRSLLPAEIVHHRNEDKQENRIENLEIKTRTAHGKHHIAERVRDSAGRLLDGRTWDEMPVVGVESGR